MMWWMAPFHGIEVPKGCQVRHGRREPPMSEISIIGLDLAKQVFPVHGADERGRSTVCLAQAAQARRGFAVLWQAL